MFHVLNNNYYIHLFIEFSINYHYVEKILFLHAYYYDGITSDFYCVEYVSDKIGKCVELNRFVKSILPRYIYGEVSVAMTQVTYKVEILHYNA